MAETDNKHSAGKRNGRAVEGVWFCLFVCFLRGLRKATSEQRAMRMCGAWRGAPQAEGAVRAEAPRKEHEGIPNTQLNRENGGRGTQGSSIPQVRGATEDPSWCPAALSMWVSAR